MAFRRKVIQAAVECFGEKGVDAVSVEEIAARAGVEHSDIEEAFTCKSFLVCAAGADKLNEVTSDYIASMPEAPVEDKILYIIERRCRCVSEVHEEAVIFYRMALEGEQPWSDALDHLIWQLSVHFATLLEHSVRNGELESSTDVPTAVKILVSVYLAGIVTIGLRAAEFDVDKVLLFIEPQVRLLISCLKA
ncbi:MAG: TetR/AcrR family transcriptional regulator [Pseudodesulfovibrio sp.]